MNLALIDRPIAFQRSFVSLGAGVTGALMLSQAVYWTRRAQGGWFWKTMDEWEAETGLTRTEQETARRRLRELGVLIERKRGIPCKTWFTVDANTLQTRLQESCKQDCGKPANSDAEIPQATSETTSQTTAETTSKDTRTIGQKPMAPRTTDGERKPGDYPPEFEETWQAYPRRAGGNPKTAAFKAWKARRREGVTAEELHVGVTRYAAYVQATGKAGTEYVKQASTFFGPDEHFRERWQEQGQKSPYADRCVI